MSPKKFKVYNKNLDSKGKTGKNIKYKRTTLRDIKVNTHVLIKGNRVNILNEILVKDY